MPGAVEARLRLGHHHFGPPGLRGAQGAGIRLAPRPHHGSHSGGYHGKDDKDEIRYFFVNLGTVSE